MATVGAPQPFVVACAGINEQAERAADDISLGMLPPCFQQRGVAFRRPEIVVVEERQRFRTRPHCARVAGRGGARAGLPDQDNIGMLASQDVRDAIRRAVVDDDDLVGGKRLLFTLRSASERKRAPFWTGTIALTLVGAALTSGRHQFRERVLDPRSVVEPDDRRRRQQARQLAQPRLPGAGGRNEGIGRHCGQNPRRRPCRSSNFCIDGSSSAATDTGFGFPGRANSARTPSLKSSAMNRAISAAPSASALDAAMN